MKRMTLKTKFSAKLIENTNQTAIEIRKLLDGKSLLECLEALNQVIEEVEKQERY